MRNSFLILAFLTSFLACKERPKTLSGEINSTKEDTVDIFLKNSSNENESVAGSKRIGDKDSLSISSTKLIIKKNVGNNHFSLSIDLPHYDNGNIDMNILSWINQNLEEEISDTLDYRADPEVVADFNEYKANYNRVYDGNLEDLKSLAIFYADKHFYLYHGDRLGIDYNIECKKIYENKDVVSFEISEFFSNYALLKTSSTIRGTTFFKFNGKRLSWAYFENSNVKNIVKKEINRQYLRFSPEAYEQFLFATKYHEFSLPDSPPYMTKQGLKFLYKIKELSPKEQDGQIACVISPKDLSILPSLTDLLQ